MKKAIPLLFFLQSLGFSRKKLLLSIKNPEFIAGLEELGNFGVQGSLYQMAFLLLREDFSILSIFRVNFTYLL